MRELSILIPARNEMFLRLTVEDILRHKESDTEIIVVADGNWPSPAIEDHPDVHIIYHYESVGQRAATNEAASISRAKFIMKADAHCSFDQGFDRKMMETCEYDWTAVPRMFNLHAFNWLCKSCGNETYQGPTPTVCGKCQGTDLERKMIWQPRKGTKSDSMMFDKDLHFQYWREYAHRPEAKGPISDTMSLIGACWMMHRARFWDLGGMDEEHGSWGQMGTEISCKTWLSGGRLIVNKNTWFAHMFRTQGGDFGFPYEISGRQVEHARAHSRKLWNGGTWPKAKYPLSWLIRRFAPVPTWDTPEPVKGLIYYTDNAINEDIFVAVQRQLLSCTNGHDLVSASLKPLEFGHNIVLPLERGHMAMFKQILAALEASTADVVFFTEHDVLYPKEHFDFTPPKEDVFYYNLNWWKVRVADGLALHFKAKQVSGMCAYRKTALAHYAKRVEMMEKGEYSLRRHFEPGSYKPPKGVDEFTSDTWMSARPYVDIRHDKVLTWTRYDPKHYRNQVVDWTIADEIPGWGRTKDRFWEWLKEVTPGAI